MFIDDTLGGNGSFKKLKAGINGNIIGNREELWDLKKKIYY